MSYELDALIDDMKDLVDVFIKTHTQCVKAEAVGLDKRCGGVYISKDDPANSGFIAVHRNNQKTIEYYGGFEYVGRGSVEQIGDYVFYRAEEFDRSDRVYGGLMFYEDFSEENQE